ncbi:thioesterase family protein [Niveomyces insectorum RCEF 264]|uniref:Thioesterase family protein n=1 Tax=Niveomyces insectorum RCEF 264 TaxID=1081102 RepID=A0A167TBA4_9HYPO|nr:thioesterase family protein [Niveomyces insectorum RCEF 264]
MIPRIRSRAAAAASPASLASPWPAVLLAAAAPAPAARSALRLSRPCVGVFSHRAAPQWLLRRPYSSHPQHPQQQYQYDPHHQQPPPPYFAPPPKPRRIRTSTLVFLFLGFAVASVGTLSSYWYLHRFLFADAPDGPTGDPLARGSAMAMAGLRVMSDALPVVQQLMAHPEWEEWDVGTRWEAEVEAQVEDEAAGAVEAAAGAADVTGTATSSSPTRVTTTTPVARPPRLTSGALGGALGRCAIATLPARTGVTARLELSYRAQVRLPGFYVIRCTPECPGQPSESSKTTTTTGTTTVTTPTTPATPLVDFPPDLRKLWCTAVLETTDGRVCLEARGLFVVPRKYKLAPVADKF